MSRPNLPEEYQCVRTRNSDPISWVFLILQSLTEDQILSAREFTELTLSLEGYGLQNSP
jgi:hypothetical protein